MEQVTGEERGGEGNRSRWEGGGEAGREGEQEKEGNWVGNKKGRRRKRTERGTGGERGERHILLICAYFNGVCQVVATSITSYNIERVR